MAPGRTSRTSPSPGTSSPATTSPTTCSLVNVNSEDCFRDFLLKRSYLFGFERSLASERMVMEPATASPWRYRRGSSSF
ncbi:hypothetical protein glysoja_039601 [Glycine soja]|uniref:Uncharacterized protein n=1 Tax=Glycine soja TaxID=3848 RepID=A0A0B2RJK1_GLYSO|nr:hypothetical protein glysoja_039601 [Glycine soja]